jgi:hypothetical protein
VRELLEHDVRLNCPQLSHFHFSSSRTANLSAISRERFAQLAAQGGCCHAQCLEHVLFASRFSLLLGQTVAGIADDGIKRDDILAAQVL